MRVERRKLSIKQSNVFEQWGNKYECVVNWLPKLAKKEATALHLYFFCYWSEKNPKQLLALKHDPKSIEGEKLLDRFVADENTGLTDAYRYLTVMAVRSFFKHNYRELASTAGQIVYDKKKPYRKPSKEVLRKLYRACYNPRDRSMLTFINSSAVAKETLSKLTWQHLEDDWKTMNCPHISVESKLLKGKGRGKYKGVRQETFLTPEAKKELVEYKTWIEEKMGRKFTKNDIIFIAIKEPFGPLSYVQIGHVFKYMAARAKLGFSPHDARRYVETTLEECLIHPNWARKIRGRKVRGEEAPYSRPEIKKLREFYEKAVPKLQFLTEEPISREQETQQAMMTLAMTKPNLTKEQLSKIREILEEKPSPIKYADLQEALKIVEEMHNETNCSNGNCQRIVSEDELAGYLAKGWHVVTALPSGRIVVESNHR